MAKPELIYDADASISIDFSMFEVAALQNSILRGIKKLRKEGDEKAASALEDILLKIDEANGEVEEE